MTVFCDNKDCKNYSDEECMLRDVFIGEDCECLSFNPIHRCGECAKFHTFACRAKYPELIKLLEEDDAASLDCFEGRSEDDGTPNA